MDHARHMETVPMLEAEVSVLELIIKHIQTTYTIHANKFMLMGLGTGHLIQHQDVERLHLGQ